MATKLEELAQAYMEAAEKVKSELIARAVQLGSNQVDLPGFIVTGDDGEIILTDVELLGTPCSLAINISTGTVDSMEVEVYSRGVHARRITFELNSLQPEEAFMVAARDL
ncbi:MAG: hypothetical protein H6592_08110 [Flavobacteriales bacterium]|nr:hypothetical protein [Flavobacteriales bacterium]